MRYREEIINEDARNCGCRKHLKDITRILTTDTNTHACYAKEYVNGDIVSYYRHPLFSGTIQIETSGLSLEQALTKCFKAANNEAH